MTAEKLGANWVRAALQVNPYAYEGRVTPANFFDSEDAYNAALLDKCDELGIGLIAVTDHWCVESARGLIAAAEDRGIVALPGFEANSSEGVHLLVLFERGTSFADVNAAIGICGATSGASGAGDCAYVDIVEKMAARGALVIPAHANVAPSGLIERMSGQPLEKMVTHPNVHAICLTPGAPESTNQDSIVRNIRPFERPHPLAVFHSDDIASPDDLAKDGGSTWFKVSARQLESIKVAVRAPTTRVSLADPAPISRALIRDISWTGGFLDGVSIPLSDDLTTLIGGRGTGKSTVIESLRYALDLPPIGTDAGADHKAIVANVLRSGTIVRVSVEVVSPVRRRYVIERVVNDPPVVRDLSGAETNLKPLDVLGRVEVYGQHELAELASNPAHVAEMLQRIAGATSDGAARAETVRKLAENRSAFAGVEAKQRALGEELSDIPRLEGQLQQFDETDATTRLAEMQRLTRDEAVFGEASRRVREARDAFERLKEPGVLTGLAADYEGLDESPQQQLLLRAAEQTSMLAKTVGSSLDAVLAAIADAEAAIENTKATWSVAVKDLREGHSAVLRKLHEDGLEPDKYLDISGRLDGLKAKLPQRDSHTQTLAALQKERDALLADRDGHDRDALEDLHTAVRAANASTGGSVIVKPVPAPDRSELKSVISRHVAGQRNQIFAAVQSDDFSVRSFVQAIRHGVSELEKNGIRGAQATNLAQAGEALCRELEEFSVGYAVEVLLDTSAEGSPRELRRLQDLSKGQRATALLLLLLGASDAALVIDQPEDDLDNRFVYKGVVARLRGLKGRRQVIASTHNANVPVLGDAELIVTMEGDGGNGRTVLDGVGSLDNPQVRGYAENLLEGGPDAFNARQHLYGF